MSSKVLEQKGIFAITLSSHGQFTSAAGVTGNKPLPRAVISSSRALTSSWCRPCNCSSLHLLSRYVAVVKKAVRQARVTDDVDFELSAMLMGTQRSPERKFEK